jgi:hypothetical protein
MPCTVIAAALLLVLTRPIEPLEMLRPATARAAPSSLIPLAHSIWADRLRPGDTAIDATAGNGFDSVVLARLVFAGGKTSEASAAACGDIAGKLLCLDTQPDAICATNQRLRQLFGCPDASSTDRSIGSLPSGVHLLLQSHESFPRRLVAPGEARIIA